MPASSSPWQKAESSPGHRPMRTLKKMPSMQRVDTSTALQGQFTVTPASARSASSINGSPGCSSYQGSPYSAFQYQNAPSQVETLHLPEPIIPPPSSMSAVYTSSYQRQNGLTRTLSTGKRALSKLGRTTSSGAASRRDPSSGPVARRRSDSKTSTAATFESDEPMPELPTGLGLLHTLASPDDAGWMSDQAIRPERRAEVVAPVVPSALLAGCRLTKLVRGKCQEKIFSLDRDGSCVSWMGRVTSKQFQIDNIKSIRPESEIASSLALAAGLDANMSRCFTINYAPSQSSKDTKSIHLLAPTSHLCSLWINTLEALAKHREELMMEMIGSERESVLRAHWDAELAKQHQQAGHYDIQDLDLPTVAHLCRKLHIHCPRSVLEDGFHAADVRGTRMLNFDQFRAFVRRLRARVDVKPLFNQLKTFGVEGISRDDFLNFLKNEQGINVALNHNYWSDRFDQAVAKSNPPLQDSEGVCFMDFASFTSFITSKDCHVLAPPSWQKSTLDRPLNEYIISSSHNTYLLGRQVNGTSSVEPYVTALRRGCRSVEIDCWDGDNNNPRVTHGYTGTTSISFIEVIRAINRCAFEASPYPLILSLEVHCNPTQQERMVDIMTECIDADKLLLHPIPDHCYDLPSPEQLKYKILVKVKATNAHPSIPSLGDAFPTGRKRSTSSPVRKAVNAPLVSSTPASLLAYSPSFTSPPESLSSPTDQSTTPTSDEEADSDANGLTGTSADLKPVHKTSKIIQRLAALGVYMQGYSYRSVADLAFQKFNHIFSINEHTAINVSKGLESKMPFEKHNMSHLCRVYPKNTRFNSSNFDPNTFWRRGVQMVALNWQTYDIHMQMNQAMFAAGTDRTGYVLKPYYLRNTDRFRMPIEQRSKLQHYQINFSIKVISAQQLPLLSNMSKNDLISPFVEVQMFSAEDAARSIAHGQGGEAVSRINGKHGIGRPFSRKTKTVPENGFNPQFNDLIELSLETKYPELVFVRFVVYQSGKNFRELAVFTAKLDSLQQGYRHLPLYNSNGEELIFSSLFCHIAKQKPKPVTRDGIPARHNSLLSRLSRSNTVDRGRTRGQAIDMDRREAQRRLNKEIEATRL